VEKGAVALTRGKTAIVDREALGRGKRRGAQPQG
jgi:hypothetical protein